MTDIRLSPLRETDRPAYEALYESTFPPIERKDLDYMLTGEKAHAHDVLVISTPDRPMAGLVITVSHADLTLLDYFAISPDLRGQGLGHAVLPLIRDLVRKRRGGHFFLEIEMPPPVRSSDTPDDRDGQWMRRRAFYFSAGMVEIGMRAFVYDSYMELLAFPEDVSAITFEGYGGLLEATWPGGMKPERI